MDSKYQRFISIDVETGGLPNKDKRAVFDIALTEVGMVVVSENLEILDTFSILIKPYKEGLIYDKGAEVASGISRQMCEENGEDINIACSKMIEFIKKHKFKGKLPIFVGHNIISFDSEFIINLFEFCEQDLFKYVQGDIEDTIKWARLMFLESTNYKLGTVCQNLDITLQDAHRALVDAESTARVWIKMLKNLRGMNNTTQTTVETHQFRKGFEL